MWIKLNNVNVLRFQGILYNFGYLPALVTTYCDNGNVLEFLSKTDRKIERILFIVSDIALRFFLSQAVDVQECLDSRSYVWSPVPTFQRYCPW